MRFSVEWEWRVELIVDAENAEAAKRCAFGYDTLHDMLASLNDLDADVSVINLGPTIEDTLPDVVAVGGEMLNPDDNEAQVEFERLLVLEERKRVQEFEALSGNLFEEL